MKYRLMNVLACPYDKTFPLRLVVVKRAERPERQYTWHWKPFCEEYCSYRGLKVKEHPDAFPCEECHKWEIETGVIYCPTCGRWYPIIEEMPRMLPDELRDEEEELAFLESAAQDLKRAAPDIADKILSQGKPFNLTHKKHLWKSKPTGCVQTS